MKVRLDALLVFLALAPAAFADDFRTGETVVPICIPTYLYVVGAQDQGTFLASFPRSGNGLEVTGTSGDEAVVVRVSIVDPKKHGTFGGQAPPGPPEDALVLSKCVRNAESSQTANKVVDENEQKQKLVEIANRHIAKAADNKAISFATVVILGLLFFGVLFAIGRMIKRRAEAPYPADTVPDPKKWLLDDASGEYFRITGQGHGIVECDRTDHWHRRQKALLEYRNFNLSLAGAVATGIVLVGKCLYEDETFISASAIAIEVLLAIFVLATVVGLGHYGLSVYRIGPPPRPHRAPKEQRPHGATEARTI